MRRIAAAACSVAALALIVASWILLRHLRRQREKRLHKGVLERTRAARELQDALLQNFQGLLLKFHAATALVIERPEEARTRLNEALAQADQAITEARDAMQSLRLPAQDLADDLLQLGTELGADPTDKHAPALRVEVRGNRRDLSPLVDDEVHRIARESIRMAFTAIRADHIEVDIHYGTREFEVHVRARGGSNTVTLDADRRHDANAYPILREQVRLEGGRLTIRIRPDAGTEVELSIPATAAYTAPSSV